MKLLRANIAYRRLMRQKIRESDHAYRKGLLARFFSVLLKVDKLGKRREQRLIEHLDGKRNRILQSVFLSLLEHRERRLEKRMRGGLAELKHNRNILRRSLNRLVAYTCVRRDKKGKQMAKINQVRFFNRRRVLALVLRQLYMHSVRSKRNQQLVEKVRERVNARVLAETVMRWKIFKLQSSTEQISLETADTHYGKNLMVKAMQGLQLFQNRQQRLFMQFNFARHHRAERLRSIAFDVLKWYQV